MTTPASPGGSVPTCRSARPRSDELSTVISCTSRHGVEMVTGRTRNRALSAPTTHNANCAKSFSVSSDTFDEVEQRYLPAQISH